MRNTWGRPLQFLVMPSLEDSEQEDVPNLETSGNVAIDVMDGTVDRIARSSLLERAFPL